MYKVKALCLLILLFFIQGCQSTSPLQVIQIPEWVKTPPLDTNDIFYGIGSGYDLNTANSAALKDVASKLGVTVQGVYSQRQQVSDKSYQNYIDDKIQLSVQETPISNYQIVKSEAINQTVYSLIKVSKSQLLINAEEKLSQENKVAISLIKKHKHNNPLIWSLEVNKALQEKSAVAYRYAAIIHLLSPEQSIDSNLSVWSSLIEKEIQNRKQLCVGFKNVNNSSEDIINIIKNSLSTQKIKVSITCANRLRIKNNEEQKIIYKKYVSSNVINIELTGENNITLASQSFTFAGQSISSFVNARKGAVAQLNSKLTKKTIWELLDITTIKNRK